MGKRKQRGKVDGKEEELLVLELKCSFLSLHKIFEKLVISHYCVELSLEECKKN